MARYWNKQAQIEYAKKYMPDNVSNVETGKIRIPIESLPSEYDNYKCQHGGWVVSGKVCQTVGEYKAAGPNPLDFIGW
ncbi:MAG: hypothetical protein GF334_01910 [Candidatus Altiarchaeales archaeon]|nr:hypothetical protein [Candidatus Altiarchaeales archaeon]